jgi:hypothetical protein
MHELNDVTATLTPFNLRTLNYLWLHLFGKHAAFVTNLFKRYSNNMVAAQKSSDIGAIAITYKQIKKKACKI